EKQLERLQQDHRLCHLWCSTGHAWLPSECLVRRISAWILSTPSAFEYLPRCYQRCCCNLHRQGAAKHPEGNRVSLVRTRYVFTGRGYLCGCQLMSKIRYHGRR